MCEVMPTPQFNVLGVAGSMREKSRSSAAVAVALDVARERGADTRLLHLAALDLPMFRPDARPDTAAVRAAVEAVRWADALVLATPDYHGSMTGAMKNFLDYHWKDLTGKLFGYVVASHEKGLTVLEQMRTAVRQCYGWSLPYGVAVHPDADCAECAVTNPAVVKRLRMLGRDIVVYGRLLREQYKTDLAEAAGDTFARA